MENDLLENIILQQDNLSEDQIQLILTNYYRDDRVSGLIEKLGYEKLKNHIPRLIELSQNYGVASRNAIKVLQDGGKDVLPFIQRAVRASKWDTWGWFWFLCALLDGCSHELAEGLKSHILDGCSRVAQSDDVIETLAMLSKNQVLTEQELLSYFQSLQPCFVINLSPLDLVQLVELKVVIGGMDWLFENIPIDIQNKINCLTHFQLKELTSKKYIKNTQAGFLILHLGFAKLKNYTANLLEFLQDINWPAAGFAASVLEEGGPEVVPLIKEVFISWSSDSTWCYWIMTNVVAQWNQDVIYELKAEILNLVREELRNDCEECAIEYLMILYENEVAIKVREELLPYFKSIISELKIDRTEHDLLQALEQEIWRKKSDRY
ncbi:DUF5071 domain-containing protein [Simkania negevensis]|uniref:DUF5071 domain-containing protein n=1 Tax=Simkania negevensis (strain ATCC VR-1471 / DSM 27360 / Z) TaxID=331113 RepID=F8L9K1_SIMNZ|nr:DUF5071 domain-containing protein [Simkania negevensis]CCB89538.1 hypothetical protein SNE_A16610 [Simkania negevensis Z]